MALARLSLLVILVKVKRLQRSDTPVCTTLLPPSISKTFGLNGR